MNDTQNQTEIPNLIMYEQKKKVQKSTVYMFFAL